MRSQVCDITAVSVIGVCVRAAEEPQNSVQSESDTKDGEVKLFAQDGSSDLHLGGDAASTQDPGLISPDSGQQPLRPPRKRRLRGGNPWRLRLDYLVAYGPQGRGTFCMVCSQVLQETKVSSFRQHIHDCHPETAALTRQERQAMAAAWTKECSADATQTHDGECRTRNFPLSACPVDVLLMSC